MICIFENISKIIKIVKSEAKYSRVERDFMALLTGLLAVWVNIYVYSSVKIMLHHGEVYVKELLVSARVRFIFCTATALTFLVFELVFI